MTAAVTMNFPRKSFGDVSCIMTLVVEANKVERLAMLLFRAHLESTGETREVVLQDGARLLPNPHVVLQGSHSDAVSEIFGPETAAAIAAAPFRRRERVAGTRATRNPERPASRQIPYVFVPQFNDPNPPIASSLIECDLAARPDHRLASSFDPLRSPNCPLE
ncbi:hypothetical protein CEP54_015903 [Fusarium duplospermum]|uniref:Uncharacterized protein n=1 Tax=Fusarium duplospermum TaxID=1325734 RepID=A0A428NK40_9HYPO|nr:hypothetical protein CEP54_015903 [Fusarium duplospermum]